MPAASSVNAARIKSPIAPKYCFAIAPMPVNTALNAAHKPLSTARNLTDVFQKYTPSAAIAATARATQPTIGMLNIAVLTALHAVTADTLKAAKPVDAMPANHIIDLPTPKISGET